jgi:Kef-type K+ transport system membrane component KefB
MMQIYGPTLLYIVGLVIALTFIGGYIMKRFGVPQVLGFMITGVILGISGFQIITIDLINSLGFIVSLALGFIGYNVGNEIRLKEVKEQWKQLTPILLVESSGTFFIVMGLVNLFTGNLPLALILGSLAAATAPAATADVVWEYKCRGPVTEALVFILVFDDILAIILSNLAVGLAIVLLQPGSMPSVFIWFDLLRQLGGSLLLGGIAGYIITRFLRNIVKQPTNFLELMGASLLLVIGGAELLHLSPLLTCIVLGVIVGNGASKEERKINNDLEKIVSPFVILFFAFIGAEINLSLFLVGGALALVSVVYIFGRFFAKYVGTYIGAKVGKAPKAVKRYLGLCLLSQAGVAVGLAVEISRNFAMLGPVYAEFGVLILNIIGLTTIINTLIGPLFVKYGLSKAGELKDLVIVTGDGGLARDVNPET